MHCPTLGLRSPPCSVHGFVFLCYAVATVAGMTVAIIQNLAGQTDAEDVERTLLELEALAGEQGKQPLTDEDESSGVRAI